MLSLLVVLLFYITRCTYVRVCVCVCVWMGCLFGIISSIPYSQTQSSSLQTPGRDRTVALYYFYDHSFYHCYKKTKIRGNIYFADLLSYPCTPDGTFSRPNISPFLPALPYFAEIRLFERGEGEGGWFNFMHGSYLQKKA